MHFYGLQEKSFKILAAIHQDPSFKQVLNTPYFNGSSLEQGASFCLVNTLNKKQVLLMASHTKDPGQHLYHMIRSNRFKSIKTLRNLHQNIQLARHLLLSSPPRILIESKKTTRTQLQELLKLDFPFYHVRKLGQIWAWSNIENNRSSFVADHRIDGSLECKNKQ